jgi:hypothetical protein
MRVGKTLPSVTVLMSESGIRVCTLSQTFSGALIAYHVKFLMAVGVLFLYALTGAPGKLLGGVRRSFSHDTYARKVSRTMRPAVLLSTSYMYYFLAAEYVAWRTRAHRKGKGCYIIESQA